MAPMSAEELQKHPEYDHTIWHLKPEKKGKVAVANARGGPIDIAYEVHGKGDRHMVVSLLYIWRHELQHPSKSGTHCSIICHTHTIRNSCLASALASRQRLLARFVSVAWTVSSPSLRLIFLYPQSLSIRRLLRHFLSCPSCNYSLHSPS
jgi:hypothetical protein